MKKEDLVLKLEIPGIMGAIDERIERNAQELREEINRAFRQREYLNLKETCAEVGISPNTLGKWRHMGLKTYVVDGITIVSRENLREFLSNYEI